MERVQTCVVGAGVLGLAVARALSLKGLEVFVLEAAEGIGTGTSSRNSEVIHAGIYYPSGSLKARSCVRGKELMYEYCRQREIPHEKCGKLIVATNPGQRATLEQLREKAAENGVSDLKLLSPEDVQSMEPLITCTGGLLSPSTGIIDSHSFMLSLQGDAENNGVVFAFNTSVVSARGVSASRSIHVDCGDINLECDTLVNCAGLYSARLASDIITATHTADSLPPTALLEGGLPRQFAKGNYYKVNRRIDFHHLVYPVPEPGGLGVHATRDLAGQVKFGPDVQWVDSCEDLRVDPSRADHFYSEIRKYYPDLKDGELEPDYCGIRPKLSGPGQPTRDFVLQTVQSHGVPGLVNALGIESPGLTASLSLAEEISSHVLRELT